MAFPQIGTPQVRDHREAIPLKNLTLEVQEESRPRRLSNHSRDSPITEAEIDDWKSYYQVTHADTFRSKFYPLLLMCLNPSLERVKFVLEFVRYAASRSVEYTGKDLPCLKELAQRERTCQRQLQDFPRLSDAT